ncbi:MAG: adenylyltransferase/cytidyltransferase family protein [Candidatus Odinarchaeia archaeon]
MVKKSDKIRKRKTVLIGGTFDIIHGGHLYLMKKASKFGDLIVVVARDENVKKIKGHFPIIPEEQRLAVVKGLKYVKKAVLGKKGGDFLQIVKELKPDYLILGPDQKFSEEELTNKLHNMGLQIKIMRIPEYLDKYDLCRTSKIIEKILREYKKIN